MTRGQGLQCVRQRTGGRHGGSFNEHGNDGNTPFERRGNLGSHEITRIIEPPASDTATRQPVVADDRHQCVTRANRRVDRIDEVLARIDAAQIHEHILATEVSLEGIVQTAGMTGGILAPVADENLHPSGIMWPKANDR